MRVRSVVAAVGLALAAAWTATAATGAFPDMGHALWARGGTRTIFVRSDCGPPPAPCPPGLVAFNPNAAIGNGQDLALDGARYGIVPFAGAGSPSRGRYEGDNMPVGSLLNLARRLAALPGNPLRLPSDFAPGVADAFDLGYVTLDGAQPAFATLERTYGAQLAALNPGAAPPPQPACPAWPACTACPPPLPAHQRVCMCPPPKGWYFDPQVPSTGRMEITLLPALADGGCPPCP